MWISSQEEKNNSSFIPCYMDTHREKELDSGNILSASPLLGSPVQGRQRYTGLKPTKGHEDN